MTVAGSSSARFNIDKFFREFNKGRLQETIQETNAPGELLTLLKEVDLALERMDRGVFGLCEVCNDP